MMPERCHTSGLRVHRAYCQAAFLCRLPRYCPGFHTCNRGHRVRGATDMPPDVLQSQELAALVRRALSELPPEYQSLLLAKYVDNQQVGHIAEQMACSEVAVRSKLARARKAFRKAFKKVTRSTPAIREVSI